MVRLKAKLKFSMPATSKLLTPNFGSFTVTLVTVHQVQDSLVPRPFLHGRGKKGEGRKGLVNNLDPNADPQKFINIQ